MKRTKHNLLVGIIIFSFLLPATALYVLANAVTILDGEDIVKNFRVAQYEDPVKGVFTNKDAIDSGKLRIAYSRWNIKDEAIQLLKVEELENEVELKYLITLTNKMYAYTAVNLYQATSVFMPYVATYEVARVRQNLIFGSRRYMTHTHYYFGGANANSLLNIYRTLYPDIATWNSQNNRHIYTGTFVFDFELNDTPFLAPVTGRDGTAFEPTFSYIAPYSAIVANNSNGVITTSYLRDEADVLDPATANVDPQSAELGSTAHSSGIISEGAYNWQWSWNANPNLAAPHNTRSFAGNVLPTPVNQPLTLTQQNGEPIFNGTHGYTQSVKDVRMRLPIGTLSPSVIESSRRLTYTHSTCTITTLFGFVISEAVSYTAMSITQPSSLEIKNRFISYDVELDVLITTRYTIDGVYRQLAQVQQPEEYYYDLIYRSGFGGALSGEMGIRSFLDNFLNWIIMLIILIAVIAIAILILRSIIRRRRRKRLQSTTRRITSKSKN